MTQETVFACDALGDLYQYNEQLLWSNKEQLALCDLLGAELAALVDAARPVGIYWAFVRATCAMDEYELDPASAALSIMGHGGSTIVTVAQLDALATLVEEEGK